MKGNRIHLVGRIDQIVRDYFENSSTNEIPAKDLMPIFIKKGVFAKDEKGGLPIRKILRELDEAGKLRYLENIKVVRKRINTYWYFKK